MAETLRPVALIVPPPVFIWADQGVDVEVAKSGKLLRTN